MIHNPRFRDRAERRQWLQCLEDQSARSNLRTRSNLLPKNPLPVTPECSRTPTHSFYPSCPASSTIPFTASPKSALPCPSNTKRRSNTSNSSFYFYDDVILPVKNSGTMGEKEISFNSTTMSGTTPLSNAAKRRRSAISIVSSAISKVLRTKTPKGIKKRISLG